MRAGGVDWRMNLYGGAGHSFTNERASALGMPGVEYHEPTDVALVAGDARRVRRGLSARSPITDVMPDTRGGALPKGPPARQSGGMTARGIELRGLAKSYGSVRAVRDVSISIDAGQTVALLGPNGAGKSTTIDMMLGLARPDRGEVTIFGQTPEAAVDAGIVGAMLQVGSLIRDLNVRELVTMVASLYPAPLDVDEVLDLTGTREVAGRRTQKLSGGQTQRVRFAAALVANPRLLVLDEPTVAMDVEGRHHFWITMREFASRGKTIVFATHYLEEADAYADRIVLMAKGRVVADGPSTEIKARVGGRQIRATLGDARPGPARRPARRGERRPPRRRRAARLPRLRRRPPSPSRARTRRPATSRCGAPGWRKPSSPSPVRTTTTAPTTRWRAPDEHRHRHLHPLRNAAHLPQHAILRLLARLPDHPVLPGGRAQPRPGAGRHLVPALLHDGHGGVGLDDGGDGQRGSHRRRAPGRLEPPAAHHAAADPRVLPGQDHDRLLHGRHHRRAALPVRAAARRAPARRRVG